MNIQNDIQNIRAIPLITAIKTPYDVDGSIDYEAMEKLVVRQIEANVKGIVVAGTTGEGHLMSWDEQFELLNFILKRFGDKIAIIGNTGSNSTREAVAATKQGFELGMTASLQVNPYYGLTNTEGMLAHFQEVLNVGPGILYNVPARTGQEIPLEVIKKATKHENFVGVKECGGVSALKSLHESGVFCWSGNDNDFIDGYRKGYSSGVISVASNVIPEQFNGYFSGLHQSMLPEHEKLVQWMAQQPNPIALNTLLAMLGLTKPVFRLPYTPMPINLRQEGCDIVRKLNLKGEVEVLDDENFSVLM